MHAVITGHLNAAIHDWRDRLDALNRATMRGTMRDGREVIFISTDFPERLYGLRLTSYEMHPTAFESERAAEIDERARVQCRQ